MSFVRTATLILVSSFSTSAFAGAISSGGRLAPRLGLMVSFQSIGSGIDGAARETYLDIVKDSFSSTKSAKLFERVAGREGEIISCIQFKEQPSRVSAQKELVDFIGTSTLTKVKSVTACDESSLQF